MPCHSLLAGLDIQNSNCFIALQFYYGIRQHLTTFYLIMFMHVFVFSGLNFQDLVMRQGTIENPPKIPFTMGFECAGEIEALGENVDRFNVSIRYCII